MPVETPQREVKSIERDLDCARCRYNLRGLEPAGRCPECGLDVADSIAADARRRRSRRPPPPSPWFAREVIEGAAASLCAFVLACVPGFLPASWFAGQTTPRAVTMSLLASAWVLTFAAVWKLTHTDTPGGEAGVSGRGRRAVALVWLSGAFYFSFAVMGLPRYGPPIRSIPLVVTSTCGVLLAGIIPLAVGGMFGRIGRPWFKWLSYLLAVLALAMTQLSWGIGGSGFGPSSLDFLVREPLPPFTRPLVLVAAPRLVAQRNPNPVLPLAAVALANAALFAGLIAAYLPWARRTVTPEGPAAPGGNTPTSSLP